MTRINLILTVFLIIGTTSFLVSQQEKNLSQVFAESYAFENIRQHTTAIRKLENVYHENSYEINLRLGWLYYQVQNHPESRKYYARAVKLLPYSIEAKLGYALPLSAMGNWDEVVSTYNKILEIDPLHSLTNYRLGAIYYDRKDYETAYRYTEKVVNNYPFDYDSVILLAWINLKLEKLREAKVLFQKALLIRPDSASALEGLGLIK